MNLQSNALKFTKSGGKIKIKAMLVKSKESLQQQNKKNKKLKTVDESFLTSKSSSAEKGSIDSEVAKFDKEYGIKSFVKPLDKEDKLVISV